MAEIEAKAHARWSASSTAANWACPGRLALVESLAVLDKESEAAAWGTACHDVSERALRGNVNPAVFLGEVVKTKDHEIDVDEEMVETATAYVGYVAERASTKGAMLFVEQNFSLASLKPPFQAGGTADAVIYLPAERLLEVVDLKGGRGVVVEVVGNPQLRTYALGALLANAGLDVERVRSTIVQPRAPHKDGRVRSEDFHVADLVEWTTDLLAAMNVADVALSEFATSPRAAWTEAFLDAGPHCKFCPAAAACPALERKALDAAGVWFDDHDAPHISNQPDALSPEELAKRLDAADMIEEWISAIRGHAHRQAESGVSIPNYVLVDKIGRRSWAAEETKVISDLRTVVGLDEDQIYERKLRSPAQIEKLGKATKAKIANMWHTPIRGTNLVRTDKTTRRPATPAVDRFFTKED